MKELAQPKGRYSGPRVGYGAGFEPESRMVREKPAFKMTGTPGFRLGAGMTVLCRFNSSILNTYG